MVDENFDLQFIELKYGIYGTFSTKYGTEYGIYGNYGIYGIYELCGQPETYNTVHDVIPN